MCAWRKRTGVTSYWRGIIGGSFSAHIVSMAGSERSPVADLSEVEYNQGCSTKDKEATDISRKMAATLPRKMSAPSSSRHQRELQLVVVAHQHHLPMTMKFRREIIVQRRIC